MSLEPLARAAACIQAGDIIEAEPLCAAVIAAEPDNADARYLLARISQKRGDYGASVGHLQRAIVARPDDANLLNDLGYALRWLAKVEAAEQAFALAVKLDPAHKAARANAAACLVTRDLPPQLHRYQALVESYRASSHMDYPGNVQIETFAQCNAACHFCPYTTMARKGTRMPMALIEKIIDDLTAIPREHPLTIEPVKVNEPFLDVRLFDVLALINRCLPQAKLKLTTNATPLTDRNLDRLADVSGLGHLFVSLNDHREAMYERVMRLPYARTLVRLEALHAAKESGAIAGRVIVTRVGDGTDADAAFVEWTRARFPAFEVTVYNRFDWIGQVDVAALGDVPRLACRRWFDMSITATGAVALCCIDGEGAHAIGDVTDDHVLAVYNAPENRRLRATAATRADVTACAQCTYK